MPLADGFRIEIGRGVEAVRGEELGQRLEHQQRLAGFAAGLGGGSYDVVRGERDRHRGGAYRCQARRQLPTEANLKPEQCRSFPRSRSPRGYLDAALAGAQVESALAPGVNALKTFDPAAVGARGPAFDLVRRRGKLFVLELDGGLALVIHLMSAGRLQLFDTRASLRDRTSRFWSG